MGDININLLEESVHKNNFNFILDSFDIKQNINTPTRINMNTGNASLIDVILTSKHLETFDPTSLPISENISDHNMIYIILNFSEDNSNI